MKTTSIGVGENPAQNPKPIFTLGALPQVSEVRRRFQIQNFELEPKSACVNCQKPVKKSDGEFCEAVKVCRDCLSIYAAIASALDDYADSRVQAQRTERFIQKFQDK